MNKHAYITILISFLALGLAGASVPEIQKLDNLDLKSNESLKALRKDVRTSIFVIKSRRNPDDLPELRFYKYTVKKGESFWTVLSKSSLDMDTIMTLNDIATPSDVKPGKTLYLPNMRGVVIKGGDFKFITRLLANERIDPKYVFKINRTQELTKKYLFIPGGRVSNLERSLFLGTGFMNPLAFGRKSSGFGTRRNPFNRSQMQFHAGVDIACNLHSKVYASREGRVVFAGSKDGYGNLVILQHEHGYQSYYGHLSRALVRVGDKVERGKMIALSGNTGRTTGPHLHFEIRKNRKPVNPGMLLSK